MDAVPIEPIHRRVGTDLQTHLPALLDAVVTSTESVASGEFCRIHVALRVQKTGQEIHDAIDHALGETGVLIEDHERNIITDDTLRAMWNVRDTERGLLLTARTEGVDSVRIIVGASLRRPPQEKL